MSGSSNSEGLIVLGGVLIVSAILWCLPLDLGDSGFPFCSVADGEDGVDGAGPNGGKGGRGGRACAYGNSITRPADWA
jgi:hypothetical protein